jgi:hypothetical protein
MTSEFISTGSSLVAKTKLEALMKLSILMFAAEDAANKDNTANPTSNVQFTITGGAQTTMAATVNLPARLVLDAATGETKLVPRNQLSDYYAFTPGTGDLQGATNLPEAVIEMAKLINYWEKQISPNIVIQQANQITVAENSDTGLVAVTLTLPVEVSIDATTGAINLDVFNYLFVIDA